MPVMDGLSATQALRRLPGLDQIPVLAMTANAMDADRDACLQAGMNDFISKPIDPAQLWRALSKWLPAPESADTIPAPLSATSSPKPEAAEALPSVLPGVDLNLGLRYSNRKTSTYLSVLRQFARGQAQSNAQIEQALASGDLALAQRLAHTVKGVAANIGATQVPPLAEALEQGLRDGLPLSDLQARAAALAPALDALLAAIGQALPEAASPEPSTTPQASPSEIAQRLAELRELLQEADASSPAFLSEHQALFQQALGERFAPLAAALQAFDLEQGLKVLEAHPQGDAAQR